jgi:hypothetical protein
LDDGGTELGGMLVVELPLNLLVALLESFIDVMSCEGLDCLLSNEPKDTLLLLFMTSDEDFTVVVVYVWLVDVLDDFLVTSESELTFISVTFAVSKMLSVLGKVAEALFPDDDDRPFDDGIGDADIAL